LNTGLQFPLAEQMEQTSRILTVPGGGTLHCDWWFTNEAVLIDMFGNISGIVTPIAIGYIVGTTGSFNGALIYVGVHALVAIIS
ncbi:hypothetical protein MJM28_31225, partial [Salmonella enterica subsp. enterica serovar Montevideo]|nr:hypothetical protein [Salmonella enterica subsp. enterica serovar Montevideo]